MEPETLMEMLFALKAQLKVRTKNRDLLEKIMEKAKILQDSLGKE